MATATKNLIVDLSFNFVLFIIDYAESLAEKKKFNMANQLFRAGTSIGANAVKHKVVKAGQILFTK